MNNKEKNNFINKNIHTRGECIKDLISYLNCNYIRMVTAPPGIEPVYLTANPTIIGYLVRT